MAAPQQQSRLAAVEAAIRDATREPRRMRDALKRLTDHLNVAVGAGGGSGDAAALRDFFLVAPGVSGMAQQSAYQTLLSALFGFEAEGSAGGWLAVASHASRGAEAEALNDFLDPSAGPLLAAVAAADAAAFVAYTCPDQFLPLRARRLLEAGPAGVAALRAAAPWKSLLDAPTLAGRPPPLRLSPGRYFLFFVAHAAARPAGVGGSGLAQPAGGSAAAQAGTPARGGAAPQQHGAAALVAGALHAGLAHVRHANAAPPVPPFRELLTRLLEHAAPLPGARATLAAAAAARAAAHGSGGGSDSPGLGGFAARLGAALPHAHAHMPPPPPPPGARASLAISGEEMVAIFREFWLSDPEDLPAALFNNSAAAAHVAGGVASPAARPNAPPPLPAMAGTYRPPTADRLAAIKLLCVYVATALPSGVSAGPNLGALGGGMGGMGMGGAPSLAALCGVPPLAASLQRPLYRLLRAALASWPADASVPIMPLLELWTAWLLPWEAARKGAAGPAAAAVTAAATPGATDARRTAHVIANAPFYLLLLQYFAVAACARVQVSARGTARELQHVLAAFAALGNDRLEALRALERAYNALVAPGDAPLAARAQAAAAAAGGAADAQWASAAFPLASAVADWEAPPPRAQAAAAAAAAAAARAPPTPVTPPLAGGGAFGGAAVPFGTPAPARGYYAAEAAHAPATPLGGGNSPFTPVMGRLGSGGGALLRNPAAAAAADRAAALAAATAAGAPGRGTLPRLLCFDAAEGVPIAVERLMQRIAAEAAAAAPGGHAAYAAELDHLLRSGVAPAALTVLRVQPPRAALAAAESVFVSQSALQRAAAEPAAAAERPGIAKRFAPERRGDWMLRPIGSDEVPILVRLLVAISQRANAALGISPPDASSPVGVPLQCMPPAWAPERVAAALQWCAARGWRVDLRFFAEKTTLAALAVLMLALRLTAAIARALAAL